MYSKRPKYVPERTCIACRRTSGKRELIRLVYVNSAVEVDPKGKKPGRGVYLCANRQCWDVGLKGNRLEYGLRTKLSAENRQSLSEYGNCLPEKENN
jgi:uncharacterized protein